MDISSLDPSGFLTDWIYLNWLLAKQNTTDGLFYDSLPNTFFSLLSLKALGDIANQEEIFNPEFAATIYCGLKILAATFVSRFCSSTYL